MFQSWPIRIKCQLCHMTFTDQSAINAHYDTTHAAGERPNAKFNCEVCGKKVTTKQSLRHHLATAHDMGDVQKFTCGICAHVFNKKSNLSAHMKTVHKSQSQMDPDVY